ncbi:MAG: hypothetical protein K6G51_04685 [Sphaerochaetaceae bacterium]|nr:hypothetical protein [Sphaerochaetaceae bacterium]
MDPRQEKLEESFVSFEKVIDNHLEDMFSEEINIHPSRMKRGVGANPIHDGIFSVTIIFSMGYGTKYGRGYIINLSISTLDNISYELKQRIEEETFDFVSRHVNEYIPNRNIECVRDAGLIKLIGNFTLS